MHVLISPATLRWTPNTCPWWAGRSGRRRLPVVGRGESKMQRIRTRYRCWLQVPVKENSLISSHFEDVFIFRRVLPSFMWTRLTVLLNPFLFHPDGLVLINRRGNLGLTREKEKEHARIPLKKSASFLFEVFCSQQRLCDLPSKRF